MRTLSIDIGNSAAKVAVFSNKEIVHHQRFQGRENGSEWKAGYLGKFGAAGIRDQQGQQGRDRSGALR